MSTANPFSGRPVSLLLVEDDDGDAKAIQRAFQKSKIGNPIHRAIDGVDALDLMKGTNGKTKLVHPYLLLVDLNMPRMNGIELVEAMREDVELRHSIVFILTTSKREEDKVAAYNLNVAGYIVKVRAGQDFLNLIDLMDAFWRIVEVP